MCIRDSGVGGQTLEVDNPGPDGNLLAEELDGLGTVQQTAAQSEMCIRDRSYVDALAALIDDIFSKGGNIIIPSFAVGRTQELLYFLREIKSEGLVKSVPNFTVCVDSPLAAEATRVYSCLLYTSRCV